MPSCKGKIDRQRVLGLLLGKKAYLPVTYGRALLRSSSPILEKVVKRLAARNFQDEWIRVRKTKERLERRS